MDKRSAFIPAGMEAFILCHAAHASGVSAWGFAFEMLEGADEIAWIIEAVIQRGFCDITIGGGQGIAGHFDAVIVQIIHGAAVNSLLKETAKIFGRHMHGFCQPGKGERRSVFAFDQFKHPL